MARAGLTVCRRNQLMQDAALAYRVMCVTALAQFCKLPLQRMHGFQPRPHFQQVFIN